jgi:hypothetical protein
MGIARTENYKPAFSSERALHINEPTTVYSDEKLGL